VQNSLDFSNWNSLATNKALSSPVHFLGLQCPMAAGFIGWDVCLILEQIKPATKRMRPVVAPFFETGWQTRES